MAQIFLDTAKLDEIREAASWGVLDGVTTNPTLMNKVGITDYEEFGRKVLSAVPDRPVSLEVFADAYRRGGENLFFRHNGHFNDRGHALVAEYLEPAIVEVVRGASNDESP